jgi:hypothetical protein
MTPPATRTEGVVEWDDRSVSDPAVGLDWEDDLAADPAVGLDRQYVFGPRTAAGLYGKGARRARIGEGDGSQDDEPDQGKRDRDATESPLNGWGDVHDGQVPCTRCGLALVNARLFAIETDHPDRRFLLEVRRMSLVLAAKRR